MGSQGAEPGCPASGPCGPLLPGAPIRSPRAGPGLPDSRYHATPDHRGRAPLLSEGDHPSMKTGLQEATSWPPTQPALPPEGQSRPRGQGEVIRAQRDGAQPPSSTKGGGTSHSCHKGRPRGRRQHLGVSAFAAVAETAREEHQGRSRAQRTQRPRGLEGPGLSCSRAPGPRTGARLGPQDRARSVSPQQGLGIRWRPLLLLGTQDLPCNLKGPP